MVFLPNHPIGSENLSDSQPILLANNQALDNTFGIDHYKFSDPQPNGGFHQQVTTPAQPSIPTTVANPIFFAFQQTANLGALQYSRGPNDAVITPVTKLYSPSTPLSIANAGSTTVLDFTGISLAHAVLTFSYLIGTSTMKQWLIRYETGPSTTLVPVITPFGGIIPAFSGSVLYLNNNSGSGATDVFWSLDLLRIQT